MSILCMIAADCTPCAIALGVFNTTNLYIFLINTLCNFFWTTTSAIFVSRCFMVTVCSCFANFFFRRSGCACVGSLALATSIRTFTGGECFE